MVAPSPKLDVIDLSTDYTLRKTAFSKGVLGRYLVGVQPVIKTGNYPVGGGIYVRVSQVERASGDAVYARRVLWRGYMRGDRPPASAPNVQLPPGAVIMAEAWATSSYTATDLQVLLTTTDEAPGSGGFIHSEAPATGPGEWRVLATTNPGPGTEHSETLPAFHAWRVRAFEAELVTDATVANRHASLIIDDGTNVAVRAVIGALTTASLTAKVKWALSGVTNGGTSNFWCAPLPDAGILLRSGSRVRTSVNNLQAGDDWGAATMLIEEWAVP